MNKETLARLGGRWEKDGSSLELYRAVRAAWCDEIGRARTPMLISLPLWMAQAVVLGAGFILRAGRTRQDWPH